MMSNSVQSHKSDIDMGSQVSNNMTRNTYMNVKNSHDVGAFEEN
jgi:hypothetical protein